MTSLLEIQRRMFEVVSTPLTNSENTRPRTLAGNSSRAIADEIIKPNDRLTSIERIELYNRQYWWRILSSFGDDFEGLRSVIGTGKFNRLALAYLTDHPSRSFTLRNLGSRLESWLRQHPEFTHPRETLALDMARLEWAEIEAFDGSEEPRLTAEDLSRTSADSTFQLQPYVRLLDLQYEVDDLLLAIRRQNDSIHDETSNAGAEGRKQHRGGGLRSAKKKPAWLVVHRSDLMVYFKRVEPEAFALLKLLREGKSLAEAVDVAFDKSDAESEMAEKTKAWFQSWAQWGWFCRPQSNEKTA